MNEDTLKHIAGIAGLVILEYFALQEGLDGVMLATTMAGVAGLAGYQLGSTKAREPPKNEGGNAISA